MTELLAWLGARWGILLRMVILVALAVPLIHLLERWAARTVGKRSGDQAAMIAGKVVRYSLTLLLGLMILQEWGFRLTALLGAAGIAGVAIGFASQTSLSNIISGLFLVWERPFQVGDALQVGDTIGAVHAIDLLSVKIRTFDNRFVRIPNETLIKGSLINITRFPIRRLDIDLGVAYKEDIGRVMKILAELAAGNPYCLDEPAPLILFKGFGDSALEILFGVWFQKTDLLLLRNSILREIKERFDAEGIEIPFPHRTLYTGEATAPFPVRIVPPEGEGGGNQPDSATRSTGD